ncbi:uncharacterized protein LOC120290770 [Eucalyptus grandis]|uniref:uncharacterized protein LOC120290770 n=1 Tax=Eucalyptus grandis TaxID=71139 RepID=UPI00192E768C|nr:uncharacterized protein LOC120290770 [Eucalyptus grandis]
METIGITVLDQTLDRSFLHGKALIVSPMMCLKRSLHSRVIRVCIRVSTTRHQQIGDRLQPPRRRISLFRCWSTSTRRPAIEVPSPSAIASESPRRPAKSLLFATQEADASPRHSITPPDADQAAGLHHQRQRSRSRLPLLLCPDTCSASTGVRSAQILCPDLLEHQRHPPPNCQISPELRTSATSDCDTPVPPVVPAARVPPRSCRSAFAGVPGDQPHELPSFSFGNKGKRKTKIKEKEKSKLGIIRKDFVRTYCNY